MSKIEKRICPCCNYLGIGSDVTCPHCGLPLISKCPECGAQIRVVFAKYCSICGCRFEDTVNISSRKDVKKKEETGTFLDGNDN